MQFVSFDHLQPKNGNKLFVVARTLRGSGKTYVAIWESEVPNDVLSRFQASRVQPTIDLTPIPMNMKQLCILFPWRIKLQSSRAEHRTIALDEGIKAFAKGPSAAAREQGMALRLGDSGA
jgi:hypothetical protein